MTTKESRRDPRSRALNLTVRYKSATVADFVEDHSYDISRGGLFIKTANPFATGTLLKFEVRIVGEKTVIDGVGRVAWRREKNLGPGKPAGMGIKFIRIDDTCVHLIEQAVARHESAENQFEEGAREQGVMLSEPPANLRGETPQPQDTKPVTKDAESEPPRAPMFPAQRPSDTTPEDASEQSMLFQTSELLKSALNTVNPEASVEAAAKQPEVRTLETHDYDDVTAEDRATLPTGSSRIPPPAVKLVSSSKQVEAEDGEDEDDGAEFEDDGSESAEDGSSESPTSANEGTGDRRRSKRPGAKRKNPKKKKRKFNYASLPAAKQNKSTLSTTPPADASSSTSPARHRSEFPGAPPAPSSNGSSFWWIATLALIAISGALYLAFSSPEHTAVRPDNAANNPSPAEATPAAPSALVNAVVQASAAATEEIAAATSVATESTASTSANHSTDSSTATDSSVGTDSAEPLASAAAAASAVAPTPTEEVAPAEPETPARPSRSRSRRRAKPEPEPVPVAPTPPPVATPTVMPPNSPSVPAPTPPQAPVTPQAPVAPVAPVVAAPVSPQVPVAPAPVTSALPPRAPAPPAASQPAQVRQAPQTPAGAPPAGPTAPAPQTPAPATAPKPPTPTPAPVPVAPLPQGKPVAPPPTRLP